MFVEVTEKAAHDWLREKTRNAAPNWFLHSRQAPTAAQIAACAEREFQRFLKLAAHGSHAFVRVADLAPGVWLWRFDHDGCPHWWLAGKERDGSDLEGFVGPMDE